VKWSITRLWTERERERESPTNLSSFTLRVASLPPLNSISKHGETLLCATSLALVDLK